MRDFTFSSLTVLFVYVILICLCALPAHAQPATCTTVQSLFCTEVDWPVSNKVLEQTSPKIDLELQNKWMAVRDSRTCKRWYRSLLCRTSFPRCNLYPPCREECTSFRNECPLIYINCDSYASSAEGGRCSSAQDTTGRNAATAHAPLNTFIHVMTILMPTLMVLLW